MIEKDRVERSSHYAKAGKPEGIVVMSILTAPFKGIAAFCVGSCKYLYRAGKKCEEGIKQYDKMVEDLRKFRWYMQYLRGVCEKDPRYLIRDLSMRSVDDLSLDEIADTFTCDKPDFLKVPIAQIIARLYDLGELSDIDNIISLLDEAIDACQLERS